MGTIISTIKDFNKWKYTGRFGHILDGEHKGEKVLSYIYANYSDEYSLNSDYTMWFRESVINGLAKGYYSIDVYKSNYGDIVVNDEKGKIIKQLQVGYIY